MKKVVYLLMLSNLFLSCKHTTLITNENLPSANALEVIRLHEGEWYSNFKNEVFIRSLRKVYSQGFASYIDSVDASTVANVDHLDFNTEVLNVVDSLATEFSKRHEITVPIENSPVIMNYCISYRNSRELDSICVLIYNKFQRSKFQ